MAQYLQKKLNPFAYLTVFAFLRILKSNLVAELKAKQQELSHLLRTLKQKEINKGMAINCTLSPGCMVSSSYC